MRFFKLSFLILLFCSFVFATSPGKDIFIPAGAKATGAFGTYWRTDLRIYNASSSNASITIYYLPRASFASHAASVTDTLGPNEVKVYQNVLDTLFGISGNTAGGFRIVSNQNIIAESRTWTPAPEGQEGTYGQRIPGIPKEHEIRAGEVSNVLYIDNTADFRTNFGLIETSGNGSTVELRLYSANGEIAAEPVTVELSAYEQRQIDGILNFFGLQTGENLRVSVHVVSGSVIPYASQVDNLSGDPIYIDGSVARQGGGGNGGNGGGEEICGNGKYLGYYMQTNIGDWEGFINAPFNITVENYQITWWNEDDQGLVYYNPASGYVLMLGFGGQFETPVPITDGEIFNIEFEHKYISSATGQEVLSGKFNINGTLNCNYVSGTMDIIVKALDPNYNVFQGKFYFNYEGGVLR